VLRFRAALDEGDKEGALALYLGDFLPGLFVRDAAGFEEWLHLERSWYRKSARAVGLGLVGADVKRGRIRAALGWCTVLDRIAPNDEEVVRASVSTLMRAGDRPGAMQRLERYEDWLQEALGSGVPADLVRLLAEKPRPPGAAAHPVETIEDPPPELLAASRQAVQVETLPEYREFVKSLPDMVYRCDIRGSFPYVNDAVVRFMGWSREEMIDLSYDDCVREDFRDRVADFYVRQVGDQIPVTYLEFPAISKDGREAWVGQRVRLLVQDGQPVGIEAVARDISARVRRETANRRGALEDRETRLLNRDGFSLVARQRIRENRRSKEPFFVIHVRLRQARSQNPPADGPTVVEFARVVGAVLKQTVRESDVLGRMDEMEIAVLAAEGGAEQAESMLGRVQGVLTEAGDISAFGGLNVQCESVVHDAAKLRSQAAVMTFGWVEDE
jgi:PAS domain S-box-containing protein